MGTFMLMHETPKIGLDCPVKTKKKDKKEPGEEIGLLIKKEVLLLIAFFVLKI